MAVCMNFRFIPANTGEGVRVVQDLTNKLKGNSYMYIWICFFSSPALFENPRGDRNYCLCTVHRSRKEMSLL